jgi:hypothetical protein
MEAIEESFLTFLEEARNRLLDNPTRGQPPKRRFSMRESSSVLVPAPIAKRSCISFLKIFFGFISFSIQY